jgi:hypothetical protein
MARGLPGLWAGDPFRPYTWGNCEQLPHIREKLESPRRSPHPLTNRTIDAIFRVNRISEGGSLSLPPLAP